MKERYYFWTYSEHYDWRQIGAGNGYDTIEELKKDNESIMKRCKYRILKAKVICENYI